MTNITFYPTATQWFASTAQTVDAPAPVATPAIAPNAITNAIRTKARRMAYRVRELNPYTLGKNYVFTHKGNRYAITWMMKNKAIGIPFQQYAIQKGNAFFAQGGKNIEECLDRLCLVLAMHGDYTKALDDSMGE